MKKVTVGGSTLYLYCNAAACFDIYEAFGYEAGIVDLMTEKGAAGYGNTLRIAALLAEQGELYRRWEGHSPADILDSEALARIVTPLSYITLRRAAIDAVKEGFSPTVEDKAKPRFRDKGLDELERAEKKTAFPRRNIFLR